MNNVLKIAQQDQIFRVKVGDSLHNKDSHFELIVSISSDDRDAANNWPNP